MWELVDSWCGAYWVMDGAQIHFNDVLRLLDGELGTGQGGMTLFEEADFWAKLRLECATLACR